jgi:hypothetical protein
MVGIVLGPGARQTRLPRAIPTIEAPADQGRRLMHRQPLWDEEDWRFAFEERAAILEFDEGLPRSEAARIARQQIEDQRRRSLQ